ncbi:MAG: TIGR01440 family protein [Clostridia bacterium]|nr:TIGR01440 family protein [Clostridia bacterium]
MENIKNQAFIAAKEIIEIARLKSGSVLVVGCSSSEAAGKKIGTYSSIEVASAIFEGIYSACKQANVYIAAQCCEHLNRAIIIENQLLEKKGLDEVNVIPKEKAGGSFATVCYRSFSDPRAVEGIKADAGLDIGDTLIGMHLKAVAVPVRLSIDKIGEAHLTAARVRPKFIGGERAVYDDTKM